jgi:RNA polymerase sigma-54 factor
MQLVMKMLQVNQIELSEMLKKEAEQNPLLNVRDPINSDLKSISVDERIQMINAAANSPQTSTSDSKIEEKGFEIDWKAYLKDSDSGWYGERVSSGSYDPDKENNIEEYVQSNCSLTEHLTRQLRIEAGTLTPLERKVGEYLIGLINSNGYLQYDEEAVIQTLGINEFELEKMVNIIQSFDPVGIGARTIQECLYRQYLAEKEQDPFVFVLIEKHLEALANNKMKDIAKAEDVELETVDEAYKEIQSLDPRPGLHFKSDDHTQYVKPDIFVEMRNGELIITHNDKYIPRLSINSFYKRMLRAEEKTAKKTVSYIKERLNAAKFLMENVERRRDTIYKVTERIFTIQSDFLEIGVQGLKPLVLKDVATYCDLHESTISRVTSSKYVQTPRGLFPLKFFFSSGTTTSNGEEVSSIYVKELISNIVGSEDSKKPFSDAKIGKMLSVKGIDIARRTVAKYREELGIRSSSKRKQFV